MILDSSAVLAILFSEPEAEDLLDKALGAEALGIGAPTLAETGMIVAARLGPEGRAFLQRLLDEVGALVVPFGDEHVRAALDAFERFGRGRHPAALNFGDCLSYATARLSGYPLLYVGDDFSRTDIEAA